MKKLAEHWDDIFRKTAQDKLGWYESDHSQTLKYLYKIPQWSKSRIFVSGVGTSGLIDILVTTGAEFVLNDLSPEAIERMKVRHGSQRANIRWLCQDVSEPLPPDLHEMDIWLDRAVLHFLTDDNCVERYFENVHKAVKSGGHALFAEFSKTGATRCAGLDVRRYDLQDLERHLPAFEPIASEEYTYLNPEGASRVYIYALFKKTK
jgi:SAM-dependent methyltransferase